MSELHSKNDMVATGSGARALQVLEVILRYGPLNPAQICQHSGLNRSSVHRAIHLLTQQGWVRNQLGNRACIATYKFDQLAVDAQFSQPIQDRIYPKIKELCQAHYLHADIAFLFGGGRIQIVESTDTKVDFNLPVSLIQSDIATSIFSIMEPAQITRLTSRALQDVNKGESEEITSGRLAIRIIEARKANYLAWSAGDAIVSVPFQDETQLFGAVRFRQKVVTRASKKILGFAASELSASLHDVFKSR